ncbi:MAG: hypothetical protein IKQ55_06220 [Kiritimatiellae bacterium]|nr:hypothetical protein [Kiritimatiellia bacterium]
MKAPYRPRAIAFGHLGLFVAFSFLHLPFMWFVRNIHRYIPSLGGDPTRLAHIEGCLGIWFLFVLLSAGSLCAGLVFLRLRTARRPPPLRPHPGRAALQTILTMLAIVTCTWPLAILLPAALRRGNRAAAWWAAVGGVALLAVPVLAVVSYWTPQTSLFWPAGFAWYMAGCLLPEAALRMETPYPRRTARLLTAVFILAAAASLATHPALRTSALRADNAARLQTLLSRVGCTLAPDKPLPGATPPVPADQDPLAAPAAARIAEAGSALYKITGPIHPNTRPGPLDADAIDSLSAFFDAHPDATTAAEAAAVPGYRSSLSGATTPGDFPKRLDPREESMDFFWIEPRIPHEFLTLSRLFAWRARLAFARGDADAGLADLARLDQLARTAARECLLIGALMAEAIHGIPIDTGVFSENLSAWPAEALRDAVRAVDAWADLVDARWPDWFGGEMLFGALWLDALPPSAVPAGLDCPYVRLPTVLAPYCNWWCQYDQNALYRHASDFLDRFLPALALPPGPDRAAAHRAIAGWLADAEADLPLGARLQYSRASFMEPLNNHLPVRARGEADYVRAAAAIELYRRDHAGTLPPDLETLIPDYLPALPLDYRTGEPLAYTPSSIGFQLALPRRSADKPPVLHFFPVP